MYNVVDKKNHSVCANSHCSPLGMIIRDAATTTNRTKTIAPAFLLSPSTSQTPESQFEDGVCETAPLLNRRVLTKADTPTCPPKNCVRPSDTQGTNLSHSQLKSAHGLSKSKIFHEYVLYTQIYTLMIHPATLKVIDSCEEGDEHTYIHILLYVFRLSRQEGRHRLLHAPKAHPLPASNRTTQSSSIGFRSSTHIT